MADDIVERLRAAARSGDMPLGVAFDAVAVADEIERLRAERNDWQREFHNSNSELGLAVDEIERLRAALAGHIIEPVPQEVLADIDSQLCEDCDSFTSVRIIERLREHGWRIIHV